MGSGYLFIIFGGHCQFGTTEAAGWARRGTAIMAFSRQLQRSQTETFSRRPRRGLTEAAVAFSRRPRRGLTEAAVRARIYAVQMRRLLAASLGLN